jgi:predicted metal-dependent hydrolase
MHGGWIAARLGRLPKAAPFQPGTVIPLRGVAHRIVHRSGERGTVWTETRDSGEKIVCVAGDVEFTDRRVHDFLKREARKELHKASMAYADALGVRVKRVSIRDQSSRWGSCTSAGSLSFSWRLVLAPPHVLDYLAAHEVAHLVEMNHSPRFWRVVDRVCDHVERAKRWLDTHGNDLHRYGIED